MKLKNQDDRTLRLSHGTCCYICVYINAVAGSVMWQLYLQHDFCNIIFKIKRKLYIASGSAPLLPPGQKFWARTRRSLQWVRYVGRLENIWPTRQATHVSLNTAARRDSRTLDTYQMITTLNPLGSPPPTSPPHPFQAVCHTNLHVSNPSQYLVLADVIQNAFTQSL
jgi:hypothetical protein